MMLLFLLHRVEEWLIVQIRIIHDRRLGKSLLRMNFWFLNQLKVWYLGLHHTWALLHTRVTLRYIPWVIASILSILYSLRESTWTYCTNWRNKLRCIYIHILLRLLDSSCGSGYCRMSLILNSILLSKEILKGDICSCPRKASLLHSSHKVLIMGQIPQVWHVVIWRESNSSSFWEYFKPLWELRSLVWFIMKIWAMWLIALISMLARVQFIILRMIFLLFPTMALLASIFVWTSIFVVVNELSWAPIQALVFWVYVKLWFPPKILPVVRKNTLVPLMIILIIGTPHCFKMKHVEIRVFIKFINKLNRYFRLWMSERAIVSIFAFSAPIYIRCTKFGFVFVRMIKFFNSIVGFVTSIAFRAVPASSYMMTHFWLIRAQSPSLIFFLVMIVRTSLQIMTIWVYFTLMDFKQGEI